MDSMTRASNGANADVYSAILSGAPFAAILTNAAERVERGNAPTLPAPSTAPTTPDLIRVLCRHLAAAVDAGDELHARDALGCLLHVRGRTEDAMYPWKAARAFAFSLDGERVTYKIERHGGRSWLQHRMTTRSVDLVTGADTAVDDHLPRIAAEALADIALAPGQRQRAHVAAIQAAAIDAVAYALDIARGDLGGADDFDIAIGWIARIAESCHASPKWRGRPGHVVTALFAAYGEHVGREMREDFHERAAVAQQHAVALWSLLFPSACEAA